MKTWTVDEMLADLPCCRCYTRERVEELWAGRERLSLLEILDLDIAAQDRVWVCCRDDHPRRAVWIWRVVGRGVREHAVHCGVPEVEHWADLWLPGEDRSAESAWAAAEAAEKARAAARAEEREAEARAAAAESAWAAVWLAAAAAEDAEYQRQIQDMRAVLAEQE